VNQKEKEIEKIWAARSIKGWGLKDRVRDYCCEKKTTQATPYGEINS
jgi:hypothetical protein